MRNEIRLHLVCLVCGCCGDLTSLHIYVAHEKVLKKLKILYGP